MRTRIFILCCARLRTGFGWRSDPLARKPVSRSPDLRNQNQPYIPPRPAPPPRPLAPTTAIRFNCCRNCRSLRPRSPPPQLPRRAVNVAPMTAQAVPALPAVFRGCWQGAGGSTRLDQARAGRAQNRFLDAEDLPAVLQTRRRSAVHAHVHRNRRRRRARRLSIRMATWCRLRPTAARTPRCARACISTNTKLAPTACRRRSRLTKPPTSTAASRGDDMMVNADVYGTRDGEPWFRAHWRADFHHFEN